jgi:small subunit ribosomal protein S11
VAKVQKKRQYPFVTVYVSSTSNNTTLVATDKGNVVAWSSAGSAGFKGTKKSTPHAATEATNLLLDKLRDMGVRGINIVQKGIFPGLDASLKILASSGIPVQRVSDRTRYAFNGTRMKGRRRV